MVTSYFEAHLYYEQMGIWKKEQGDSYALLIQSMWPFLAKLRAVFVNASLDYMWNLKYFFIPDENF